RKSGFVRLLSCQDVSGRRMSCRVLVLPNPRAWHESILEGLGISSVKVVRSIPTERVPCQLPPDSGGREVPCSRPPSAVRVELPTRSAACPGPAAGGDDGTFLVIFLGPN